MTEEGVARFSDKSFGRWAGAVEAIRVFLKTLAQMWEAVMKHNAAAKVPQRFFHSHSLNRLMVRRRNNYNKHASAGQLNSFTNLRALLVLHYCVPHGG
jgi:hypothetical protein